MATPNRAINPTAEETFKVMPLIFNANIPPNNAKGTVLISNPACLNLPNAPYNNTNINASAKGAIKKGYVVLINLSCIGVANPLCFEKTKETLSDMGVILTQS